MVLVVVPVEVAHIMLAPLEALVILAVMLLWRDMLEELEPVLHLVAVVVRAQ